ncbi:GTP cyclohydrolase II-domain-containing protein, partial [Zopfochytrium polystomum]
VKCEVRTRIPSEWGGEHHVLLYSNDRDSLEHLALRAVRGCAIADADDVGSSLFSSSSSSPSLSPSSSSSSPTTTLLSPDPLLARIHSCCFTGETLGSLRCDCKEQLQVAMQRISSAGAGVVVYLQQEGRGIGLQEKLKAYNLIDRGYDTLEANVALGHPADARTYRVAAAILRDLGVGAVKLLTNNPDKMAAMERDGVVVDERVPMLPESWSVGDRGGHVDDRDGYLITKAKRMGHMIDVPSNVLKAVTENGSGLSTVGSNGSPTPSL